MLHTRAGSQKDPRAEQREDASDSGHAGHPSAGSSQFHAERLTKSAFITGRARKGLALPERGANRPKSLLCEFHKHTDRVLANRTSVRQLEGLRTRLVPGCSRI